jgi:hypothetical protein
MKLLVVLTIFLCSSCNNKATTKTKVLDAKVYLDTMREPFLNLIPDSLKQWVPIFDSVGKADRKFRSLSDPSLLTQHRAEQKILDSLNQIQVMAFLDKYGYPTYQQVGMKGMHAIKMVIQHSSLKIQKRYYHIIVEAFKKGKVSGETLALLEDRINVLSKRYQYYGTQLTTTTKGKYILFPVYNIDSVDVYRKRIGIDLSIKDYLKNAFNTKLDIKNYKKHLDYVVGALKISDSSSLHYEVK